MPVTYQQYIDRAVDIASGATQNALQDATTLAQSLVPETWNVMAQQLSRTARTRMLLRRTINMAVSDGVGVLPSYGMAEFAWEADVVDKDGEIASYVTYDLFIRPLDPRIAHFSFKKGVELHYLPVDGEIGVYGGNLEVTIPCVPEVPGQPTILIAWPDEVIDDAVRMLVDRMITAVKAVA
jgi:hypothetical protein